MNTVIYHSADFDGIFCREIARKFLSEDTTFIGWTHGDPKVPMPTDGYVFIMDLPPECLDFRVDNGDVDQIAWIDHHKTAMDVWDDVLHGYRIDGVAACRLAWQYFVTPMGIPYPNKQEFIDRTVAEPLSVRWAGEYDVWDKRDAQAAIFQCGLLTLDDGDLRAFEDAQFAIDTIHTGYTAERYAKRLRAEMAKSVYPMDWEGLRWLALNSVSTKGGSLTFESVDQGDKHDALIRYGFTGKKWTVTMYHAKNRTDIDLSEIAKRHGGGGHRGACGFTCDQLPFPMSHDQPSD